MKLIIVYFSRNDKIDSFQFFLFERPGLFNYIYIFSLKWKEKDHASCLLIFFVMDKEEIISIFFYIIVCNVFFFSNVLFSIEFLPSFSFFISQNTKNGKKRMKESVEYFSFRQ